MVIYVGVNGYLDDLPVDKVLPFEEEFLNYMHTSHPEVGEAIAKTGELSKETEEKLKAAIIEFKKGFVARTA